MMKRLIYILVCIAAFAHAEEFDQASFSPLSSIATKAFRQDPSSSLRFMTVKEWLGALSIFPSISGFSMPPKKFSLFFLKETEPLDFSFSEQTFCFFTPPKEWLLAEPDLLSPRVKIGFLEKRKTGFCPSLNLATEEVDLCIEDYLRVIQRLHEKEPGNRWRSLGKITTSAGDAHLTEIDTKTQWGPVRMLQMVLLRDKTAYILTAAALKSEVGQYYKSFQEAFHSFALTKNLLNALPQDPLKERIEEFYKSLIVGWKNQLKSQLQNPFESKFALLPLDSDFSQIAYDQKGVDSFTDAFQMEFFQKNYWEPFQTMVLEEFSQMGAYWQILFLQSTQEHLHTLMDGVSKGVLLK